MSKRLIYAEDAIEALEVLFVKRLMQFDYDSYEKADEKTQLVCDGISESIGCLLNMPSAEPLTDAEQRIFLNAISREKEVCRKVDAEWGEGDEECEINLVHACHEIVRKVKGALWT